MASNNKEQFIRAAYQQYQPAVVKGMIQLFQRQLSLSMDKFFDGITQEQVSGQEFPCVLVSIKAGGESAAKHQLAIPTGLAANLYGWMLGQETPEKAGEELLEGLQEGANQIIGQLQAAVDGTEWNFQTAEVTIEKVAGKDELTALISGDDGVAITYTLEVEGQSHTLYHFCQGLTFGLTATEDIPDSEKGNGLPAGTKAGAGDAEEAALDSLVDVHNAEFDTISSSNGSNGNPRNIAMLLDVELEVYVELGRKRMKIQDLLKLGKGSLIELDRSAGEPLSIFIGDKKLAEGEVVVVDDRFGIRITQLIGPKERLKSLV